MKNLRTGIEIGIETEKRTENNFYNNNEYINNLNTNRNRNSQNQFNNLNNINSNKLNNFNSRNHIDIEHELAKNNLNIRIVESPAMSKNKNEILSQTTSNINTWKKKTAEEEILDNLNINFKKSEITSQEFFKRKSQVYYIKKVLSPVRAIDLKSNYLNTSINTNNSSNRKLPLNKININANILKSDLILINNMIKKEASIINYFKCQFQNQNQNQNLNQILNERNSLSDFKDFKSIMNNTNNSFNFDKPNLQNILIQKRCFEIENFIKEKFSDFFEKLNENSKNMDYLMNHYKCITKDELIQKMALENFLFLFLFKQIDDLFFLNNLEDSSNENSEFISSYSESYSKIQNLKCFIDIKKKLLKKNTFYSDSNSNCNSSYNFTNGNNSKYSKENDKFNKEKFSNFCCNHDCKLNKDNLDDFYELENEERFMKRSKYFK
jgi:hypothetical protein